MFYNIIRHIIELILYGFYMNFADFDLEWTDREIKNQREKNYYFAKKVL